MKFRQNRGIESMPLSQIGNRTVESQDGKIQRVDGSDKKIDTYDIAGYDGVLQSPFLFVHLRLFSVSLQDF